MTVETQYQNVLRLSKQDLSSVLHIETKSL